MTRWDFLTLALCLATGCSSPSSLNDTGDMGIGGAGDLRMSGGDDDLGPSDGDMGSGGGGDMNSVPSLAALQLVAGQFGGPGTADRSGTAARFDYVTGVTYDGAGNLYVAESYDNNKIRKIALTTGATSSITMPLQPPSASIGTTVDDKGNLYFTVGGFSNGLIGQVALSTGQVTTLVGNSGNGSSDGNGAAAKFNQPHDLAYDGAGNLYVADSSNHLIRKIVIATGDVTTVAGVAGVMGMADGTGSAALFNDPRGITWDGAGNLYVHESGNHALRKIVAATRVVTTISTQVPDFSRVAYDGVDSFYFSSAAKVNKLVATTGTVTAVAGSTSGPSSDGTGAAAVFDEPAGVALDGNGNLYVGDNYTVRKVVLSTADVTTVAGRPAHRGSSDGTGTAARFLNPTHIAADGAGNLYVLDTGNIKIRQVGLATGEVTTLNPSTAFKSPRSLAWAGSGLLYVMDNAALYTLNVATGAAAVLAGVPGSEGALNGTATSARFSAAAILTVDTDGTVYISDTSFYTIRKYVPSTGAVTTIAGTAAMSGNADGTGAAARFYGIADLVTDGAGKLYIVEPNGSRVRQMVLATSEVTTIAGTFGIPGLLDGIGAAARFGNPQSLAYDGAGSLYIGDGAPAGAVRRLKLSTFEVTTAIGVLGQGGGVLTGALPAGVNNVQGLAWIPNQGLAISDFNENAILFAPIH